MKGKESPSKPLGVMGMGAGSQWSSMRFRRCAQISALLLAGSVLALTPRWTAMLLMDCNVAVLERLSCGCGKGRTNPPKYQIMHIRCPVRPGVCVRVCVCVYVCVCVCMCVCVCVCVCMCV